MSRLKPDLENSTPLYCSDCGKLMISVFYNGIFCHDCQEWFQGEEVEDEHLLKHGFSVVT